MNEIQVSAWYEPKINVESWVYGEWDALQVNSPPMFFTPKDCYVVWATLYRDDGNESLIVPALPIACIGSLFDD